MRIKILFITPSTEFLRLHVDKKKNMNKFPGYLLLISLKSLNRLVLDN